MKLPDWFISDTHFGHANINKYAQRITPTCPSQFFVELAMLDNWHELVKPEDTILHLGDLAFKGYDLDALIELPGTKLFVRGNHDKHLSPATLKQIGFEEIEAPTYEVDGVKLLCTHYPQERLAPKEVNICGHVHNNSWNGTPRHINVSVELWHYAPVSGRFLAEKAKFALANNLIANADYGPRNVKYKGR